METIKIKKRNYFIEGKIEPHFIGEQIAKHSVKKNIGAHSVFLGQVRNDEVDGKYVFAIEYSCYKEMAEKIFEEIKENAFSKYALTCLHIYHSLGKVNAGEICLFVFTSSKHRKDAINACNEIVEEIKNKVPVWGKEIFEDKNYQWKINH